VISAFDNTRRGYESNLSLFLQLRDGDCAAVAHCGFYFIEGFFYVIVERSCVGYVGVNALLEGKLCLAAKVVTLPVSCSV